MDPEELKKVVRQKYGVIASQSDKEASSCCCSSSCCSSDADYTVFSESYERKEGYNPDADLNLGCGIPTDFAGIKEGDHVLDLGSGAGNDCFVARAIVGDKGKVTGIDFTDEMLSKARTNKEKLGFQNVEFVKGDIESMPFSNGTFDVVISNCVLNLVPDKSKAFSEIYRVLKPGGHFCVSDVVIKGKLSKKLRKDAEMYAGCVSGASEISEYLEIITLQGFTGITIHKQKEIRLPDEINAKYDICRDTGIFSITVSGTR